MARNMRIALYQPEIAGNVGAILAADAILATQDAALAERLDAWRARQTDAVAATVED